MNIDFKLSQRLFLPSSVASEWSLWKTSVWKSCTAGNPFLNRIVRTGNYDHGRDNDKLQGFPSDPFSTLPTIMTHQLYKRLLPFLTKVWQTLSGFANCLVFRHLWWISVQEAVKLNWKHSNCGFRYYAVSLAINPNNNCVLLSLCFVRPIRGKIPLEVWYKSTGIVVSGQLFSRKNLATYVKGVLIDFISPLVFVYL